MNAQLDAMCDFQGRWSKTASVLKKRYESARMACFFLSILAALLAALASQLPDGKARMIISVASGGMLAIIALVTARLLTVNHTQNWLRARAASEAFKRIGFTYAAQAAPYDQADRDDKVTQERKAVVSSLGALTPVQLAEVRGSCPVEVYKNAQEYIESRARKQKDWFLASAQTHAVRARRLRVVEFVLALTGAVITAAIGVVGKTTIAGLPFDFVAFTGVLTTLSGAVLAYIEASRLDFLVSSYTATADTLRELLVAPPVTNPIPNPQWSAFVAEVENVLATENSAWMAKMGAATE